VARLPRIIGFASTVTPILLPKNGRRVTGRLQRDPEIDSHGREVQKPNKFKWTGIEDECVTVVDVDGRNKKKR
jgi:hypothetical protein